MTRQKLWQQPPPPGRDYRRFPSRTLTAGATWYRDHDAGNGPWWFSSGPGRFDLSPPHGSCYLTDQRADWPVDPDPVPARRIAEEETTIMVVEPPTDDQVTIVDVP